MGSADNFDRNGNILQPAKNEIKKMFHRRNLSLSELDGELVQKKSLVPDFFEQWTWVLRCTMENILCQDFLPSQTRVCHNQKYEFAQISF
jgi:hypothetical protein